MIKSDVMGRRSNEKEGKRVIKKKRKKERKEKKKCKDNIRMKGRNTIKRKSTDERRKEKKTAIIVKDSLLICSVVSNYIRLLLSHID
jgi:hypothetical protein